VKYEIVEIEKFNGGKAKIYSIIPDGDSTTLFDNFIKENKSQFLDELKEINKTLYNIGHNFGARESFFKINEGKMGDFVCALYDDSERNLRLFCMRFGMDVVILGGGAEKPKSARRWQDDPILSQHALQMIKYANDIIRRLDVGDLVWSSDLTELEGNLDMNEN
jgi:hypothetical protein